MQESGPRIYINKPPKRRNGAVKKVEDTQFRELVKSPAKSWKIEKSKSHFIWWVVGAIVSAGMGVSVYRLF